MPLPPRVAKRTDPQTQTCSNGVEGFDANGVVCCPLSCGGCSGSKCASMPGGYSGCCGGGIKASGVLCSESATAPCVIDGEAAWRRPSTERDRNPIKQSRSSLGLYDPLCVSTDVCFVHIHCLPGCSSIRCIRVRQWVGEVRACPLTMPCTDLTHPA